MKIYEACKKRENILKYLSTYLITMFLNALFICFQLFRSALTRHKTVKCQHNKKKKENNCNNYCKKHILTNNYAPWLGAQPQFPEAFRD